MIFFLDKKYTKSRVLKGRNQMNIDQKHLLTLLGEQLATIIELEQQLNKADVAFEKMSSPRIFKKVKR